MKRLILIAVLLCSLHPLPAQCTCAAGYTWFRTITIDPDKVGATDQTNFPVLISSTIADLKTVANGGDVTDAGGDDIIVANTSGTKLDHEVETYTDTTGLWNAHVEFPTVSTSVVTVGCLNYANSSVTTSQQAATGVWDANFKSVLHMNNASSPATDSTSNGFNGAESGGVVFGSTGKIGNAVTLDATNDYLNMSTNVLLASGSAFTVSWWENIVANTNAFPSRFVLDMSGTTDYFMVLRSTHASYLPLTWGKSPVVDLTIKAATAPTVAASVGVWRHWVITGSDPSGTTPGNFALYVDGTSYTTSQSDEFGAITVNRIGFDGGDNGADAVFDEVRVSSGIARSADWAVTEYNNQNSPSTFYAIGAETSCSAKRPSGLRLRGVGD